MKTNLKLPKAALAQSPAECYASRVHSLQELCFRMLMLVSQETGYDLR